MDCTKSDEVSNKSMNVEEKIEINEYAPGDTSFDFHKVENKDNVCVEFAGENEENGVTSGKQKEPIEILKVELVAAGQKEFGNVGIDKIVNDVVHDENGIVVEKEEESSGIDLFNNEAALKYNKSIVELNEELAPLGDENIDNNLEEISQNTEVLATTTISGLSLLAQYQSDDDTESVIEVPLTSAQDYRNQVVEIDSDSDSDTSTDSSDVEYLSELRKTIEKRIEASADEDDDEAEDNIGKRRHQQKLKVKGEMMLEDLPPIQDLQITVPEDECIEFGKIHSIIDQLLLVNTLPNSILLDLGTVMFLEKGQKVLGEVFDVLGQVADPLYCVRFNSNQHIKEKQIDVGDVVYVAPKTQYTQFVILSNLMRLKGSDASWENDIEPPPRFLDYSDDEQEQMAKRQLRNKERPIDNDDPSKRTRTVDNEDNSTPNISHSSYNAHRRNRYAEQRTNRGPAGLINEGARPRYNGPQQNHHRSSWHSNYYPQSFTSQPPSNYDLLSTRNQSQYSQPYGSHMPTYAMPPMHNTSYPPPQPNQYGAPPLLIQHAPPLMPNTYSVRPPTLQGPHVSHHYQYSSNAPPPSESQ